MKTKKIAFIGAGQAATTLTLTLKSHGFIISAISSLSGTSAIDLARLTGASVAESNNVRAVKNADVVFIAVPDDSISKVADELVMEGEEYKGMIFAHLSGVHSSDVLAPLRDAGASVMSFHPAQSFAGKGHSANALRNIVIGMEGDTEALAYGEKVAHIIGAKTVILSPEYKILYHVANVAASNYFIALMWETVSMLEKTGIRRSDAMDIILPLVQSTFDNLKEAGIPGALTGPISRGDISTVKIHIEALKRSMPEGLALYCELGKRAVKIAVQKGTINEETAKKIEKILSE